MPIAYNNKIYDIMIIGGKADAKLCLQGLLATKKQAAILVVASRLADLPQSPNIDYVEDKVVLSSYNHGLIRLDTSKRFNFLGRKLIIATGTKPKMLTQLGLSKLDFKSRVPVYYRKSELDGNTDLNKSLLIVGSNLAATKFAAHFNRMYKTVYMIHKADTCYEDIMPKHAKNVVPLSFTTIMQYNYNKATNQYTLTLDTYDEIVVDDIIASVGTLPDINWTYMNMFSVNEDGYIIVDDNYCTKILPNVYAVGGVTRKDWTKENSIQFANSLLA